jgi:hypothetical protein
VCPSLHVYKVETPSLIIRTFLLYMLLGQRRGGASRGRNGGRGGRSCFFQQVASRAAKASTSAQEMTPGQQRSTTRLEELGWRRPGAPWRSRRKEVVSWWPRPRTNFFFGAVPVRPRFKDKNKDFFRENVSRASDVLRVSIFSVAPPASTFDLVCLY